MYDAIISTKIGHLGISLKGDTLSNIDFDVKQDVFINEGAEISKITGQLQQYFNLSKPRFSIEVEPQGTDFQIRVWKALQQIPFGETRTYGDVATQLNSSPRAVGNACRRNPIPIIIPCHRVVAKTGIGGFSGQTKGFQIDRKQALLKLEAEA
jgi:methylated-DNA-[protein]-cysteine S-methyltransferase